MHKVTNVSRTGLDFIVGVKDGAAITEHVKAGETREIAIDAESATVKGRVLSGLITIAPVVRRTAKSENPAS
jgi:hypothetical protein